MAAVWLAFWALMLTVAVQEARLDGENAWRPWIAEGSSMLLATVFVIAHWRYAPKLDGWLRQPALWFARALVWVPPVAVGFVFAVYALRHGLAALLGQPYAHPPLREIWLYEALKFAVFYLLFTGVMFGWRTYGAWVASRLAAERQARLLQEAQMLQLTQQIQPHFLFNALNTVCSFIHSEPDRAETLLLQLAALLRAATDAGQRPQQALADELRLLKAYAALMHGRFADRAVVAWDLSPQADRCPVPTLGLQPLLENCFRHVVETRREPTHITVRTRCIDGRLTVCVEDDGTLASDARFGVGLGNLANRLQALHGDAASVTLTRGDSAGTVARMTLPCAC